MADLERIKTYLEVLLLENAPDTEKDGYPPPAPPVGRKRDIFNPEDFREIDRRARQAPTQQTVSYNDLLSHLTEDLTTDIQKVRALFMWMGTRELVDESVYNQDLPASTPYCLMQLLATTKSGYANVFAVLCRLAGLPCVVLKGADKQAGSFSVGQRKLPTDICSWNAVYVDGSWRIVDPQGAFTGFVATSSDWLLVEDSGVPVRQRLSEAGTGRTLQRIEEFYFLPDPDDFVHLSRPQDEAWQLIAEPWSATKFLEKPLFTRLYLTSEWKLSDNVHSVVNAPAGICCITFDQVPESEGTVGYKLFFNEKLSKASLPEELQLDSYVITTATAKTQSVFTRLPEKGIYKLEIENKNKRKLCEVRIEATGKIEKQKRFPDIPEAGLGFSQEAIDAGFVDPSREDGMVVAQEGEKVRIRFRTKRPLEVRARLVHSRLTSEELSERVTQEEDEEDRVTVTVRVPYEDHNPEFSLQIDAREKGVDTDYINVLNYLLTPDKNLVYAMRGKEQQITDELRAAMKDDDVHRLESGLLEYRRSHLSDNNLVNQAYTRLFNLHRKAVCDAESANFLEQLGVAIDTAHNSQVAYLLRRSNWLSRAEATRRRLSRLASVTHNVQKLSSRQVSEVQTYNHPHDMVRVAITATYILLGESQKKLKNWKYVQSLLRTHGPGSILQRIKTQNVSSIDKGRVDQAASLLSKCTSPEIKAISIGSAAFYEWSKAVVEERSREDSDNASRRDKKDDQNKDKNENERFLI